MNPLKYGWAQDRDGIIMRRFAAIVVSAFFCMALLFAMGCSSAQSGSSTQGGASTADSASSGASAASSQSSAEANADVTDYSKESSWFKIPTTTKDVDTFYIYPTV